MLHVMQTLQTIATIFNHPEQTSNSREVSSDFELALALHAFPISQINSPPDTATVVYL